MSIYVSMSKSLLVIYFACYWTTLLISEREIGEKACSIEIIPTYVFAQCTTLAFKSEGKNPI